MAQHRRARSGWHDDGADRLFKNLDGMDSYWTRLFAQSGVKSGLPAAGLPGREFDHRPSPLQNAHDSLANLWVQRVDDTGDKKLYGFLHPSILSEGPVFVAVFEPETDS